MENNLITWAFMIITALIFDAGIYIFLRLDWKKNGISLPDRFLNLLFVKVDGFFEMLKARINLALLKYHKAVVDEKRTSAQVTDATQATPTGESVPVLVSNVGNMRRIKFFVDMPLDSQVDVRIGATREAGVTVEKREL